MTRPPRQHDATSTLREGNLLARLTERERTVLALISEGKSNKEIAQALYITTHTVKAHISRLLHKLGKETRIKAAILWATSGLRSED